MVKHVHAMDWSAAVLDRGVRFRLWAPSVSRVTLACGASDDDLQARQMDRLDQGWWQADIPVAVPGWRYGFQVDGGCAVPDPASRYQPDGCHGSSQVVDPAAFHWRSEDWSGRPWHEAVVYELHVGTFTPDGTFAAVMDKLDVLVALGVTAIELMPLAEFPGQRNWGYDGVLPFAPDSSYGTPDDLKTLIDEAHRRGLMVLLDVVYNHFGPEGNYLGRYATSFFNGRHQTPWGDAINFDAGEARQAVRSFFLHNALYWLEEYCFDGLRLDAVHAIRDDSAEHVLAELARAVSEGPGVHRHVHLVLENDLNEARWLGQGVSRYQAQWNDDFHHALHVAISAERDSYYGDYAERPVAQLARTLAEGFAYQGEHSPHRGVRRGEASGHLPPTAFLAFLQNHDQVGNRARGERIHECTHRSALRAATEVLLLNPMPPLLFMGQEWLASSRFPFFCDYQGELAEAVREGRLREFAAFDGFGGPEAHGSIPDPVAFDTFLSAKLDWHERLDAEHGDWWRLFQQLLALRRRHLVPLLALPPESQADYRLFAERAVQVRWYLGAGARYTLSVNLGDQPVTGVPPGDGTLLYGTPALPERRDTVLPPWSTRVHLQTGAARADMR